MESYYGKCGKCRFCNLYNKNGSHFRCTRYDRWVLATERSCDHFEGGRQSDDDIEKARRNMLR